MSKIIKYTFRQCENILMKENIKKKPESTPFLMHEYSDTGKYIYFFTT